jgi:LacI family transcriptional regulator
MVFFDRVVSEISGPKVITNDFRSSFQATEHLINNGCKKNRISIHFKEPFDQR